MRVSLQPVGTRGDVEPMSVLGRALCARGHDVIFGAPEPDHQAALHQGEPAPRARGVPRG